MRGSPLLSLILLLFSLGAPLHAAALRVKGDARGPVHDGTTWDTAFRTIQDALDASDDGDEIRVAWTAEAQNLVVTHANITLQGFFAGYETTGVPAGETPASMFGTGADLPTLSITASAAGFRMSGFHVSGASRRGAIRCDATGVVISRNTITNNGVSGGDGGGIVCRPGSEVHIHHNLITKNTARHGAGIQARGADVAIINNVIEENAASFDNAGQPGEAGDYGGGIFVLGGTALIKNNEIAFNTVSATAPAGAPDTVTAFGAGIALMDAAATVTNNTVAFNKVLRPGSSIGAAGAGGGVYFTGSGVVANNIIAFNEVNGLGGAFTHGGLFLAPEAPDAIAVTTNLFHANVPDESADYAGTGGNLSADPKFVGPGPFFYNFRLQPGSPARDAGDDAWVQPGDLDQNGQQRIRGLHVDMGAYEAVPTAPSPSRIYVRPDGSDAADGLTWETARATVAAALARVGDGGEVWVAAGTYPERLTLRGRVRLLGGFAGSETEAIQRNARAHPTVLDGQSKGTVVAVPSNVTDAVLDGFTVRGGGGVITGAGIASAGVRTVIQNNVIEENVIAYSEENPIGRGGGVYIDAGSATVRNNVIRRNAVRVTQTSTFPQAGDRSQAQGAGLFLTLANVTVVNNLIVDNAVSVTDDTRAQAWPAGSAIYGAAVSGLIANNTISGNTSTPVRVLTTSPPEAGAVFLTNVGAGLTLANNIVAFNTSGLMQEDSAALFYNNDVFGNGTDFGSVRASEPLSANGNISADPLFVDRAAGDFHLQPASPAVDAGSGAYVSTETDLDGHPRVTGARVDMGAYELPHFVDAVQALRIAGGLETAPADLSALDVEAGGVSAGVVDIADAVRLMRTAGE